MYMNIQEFLTESGITESFYPGKRLVQPCKQLGEFKSHCVVLDWRSPERVRIEIKAGLSGRDLEPRKLKYYPVCFQSPTYVEIELVNDNKEDEGEEDKGSASGKGSAGGKGLKKKSLSDLQNLASEAFGTVREGKIPAVGKIVEMVVMGKQIAAEAFGNVMEKLSQQIGHAKISATDLLAQAGKFVTTYTPPAFLKPKGTEDKVYKYDRLKNENIGYNRSGPG